MKTEFEKYWNDTYEVMVISTVLDLRFIMKILEYIFPEIHGDDSSLEIERVHGFCYKLMKECQLKSIDRMKKLVMSMTSQILFPCQGWFILEMS